MLILNFPDKPTTTRALTIAKRHNPPIIYLEHKVIIPMKGLYFTVKTTCPQKNKIAIFLDINSHRNV